MVMSTLVFSIASGGIVKDVVGEHYQVCQLARFDGAFDCLLMLGKCGAHRVGVHGLRDGDALLGNPAVGILAVEGAASDGGIDAHDGIQRRNRPVGTEGECCTGIQQRFPGIARLDTLAGR